MLGKFRKESFVYINFVDQKPAEKNSLLQKYFTTLTFVTTILQSILAMAFPNLQHNLYLDVQCIF